MDLSDGQMRVAIVGSRRRADRSAVEACVAELPKGSVVVSGGCRGVDRWAAEAARLRGLDVAEHKPELDAARSRGEAARRYYERNQRVVDDCDRMIAFPAADRPNGAKGGGTEDTIRRAIAAGKCVQLR
jgi:hypothetical protein